MKKINLVVSALLILTVYTFVFGQDHTENKADQSLRGSGRVNSSTLGMEFDVPLGSYPGRGINIPVSLRYSSKVWRMENTGSFPKPAGGGGTNPCVDGNEARFSEDAAGGWTTSLQKVYVEYTGYDNRFNGEGYAISTGMTCIPSYFENNSHHSFVRRIQVHLPGGESHELRMDELPLVYERSGGCSDPNAPCTNSPELAANWNGWFYAVDGSNLRYFEDRTNGVYYLQLPDGSRYNFNPSLETGNDYKTIRKSQQYVDRNGNQTNYHEADSQHPGFPNGYWTDTVGRTIGVPLPETAPSSPGVQTYEMPGLTAQEPVTYKFHWKRLKGADAANSSLTNFSQSLKYLTDWGGYPGTPNMTQRADAACLFHSGSTDWAVSSNDLFNPILLVAIELPSGQMYEFSYNEYGEIDRVIYPTGGKEVFTHAQIPALSETPFDGNANKESNRGVTNRKLYPSKNASAYYDWTYTAAHLNSMTEYKTTIINPDLTKVERYLYKGQQNRSATNGSWGYSDAFAGMAYKEEVYNNSLPTRQLVSRKLTTWDKKAVTITGTFITADYLPRVTQEESIVYDADGNGISATTKYEYEGYPYYPRDTPLLQKKTMQYAFVQAGAALPSAPVRTVETTYLIYDEVNYPSSTDRTAYRNRNMVGLATVSKVKDGAGTIVSQSEMKYDESGTYPLISAATTMTGWQDPNTNYRGNPTTLRVWDSTKGLATNTSAYISTHAQFDNFGNQRKAWDALGNLTETDYASPSGQDYKFAFPTKVTTAVPDPNPTQNPDGLAHGSNSAFETTATFNVPTGLPLTTTDANGQTTTMEYDPVTLRPKKVTPPSGAGIAETIYHDEPDNYWVKNKTQIDTNKWAESITYFDGLGRAKKTEQIDAQGNIFVEKEFDAEGRVKRVTNPYRATETIYWTTNVYDESSRVKEVVLPDASTVKTDYGVSVSGTVGITKQITDQAGKKRKGITDALGRMIQVIEDPSNSALVTNYTFDALGNLRKTAQGDQSRYFSYDSLGRLLRAKQPEQDVNTNLALSAADAITGHNQWSVKYVYDDNGNITSTTDAKNVSVAATYDKFNRLTFRNYSDATPDVNFYYDGTGLGLSSIPASFKGKTTKVTSSVSETRYTSFDNLGRLLTSEQRTTSEQRSGAQPAYASAYTYNLSGALVTETYPSGRVVTNQFDQDGDLANVSAQKPNLPAKTYLSDIGYNSAGAITKMRLGNGRWESAIYNERMQVTQIALGNSNTDKSLLKLDYSYATPNTTDNNGSLREQKIAYAGLSNQITQAYAYDDLNRLQSATETVSGNSTPSWKQTFIYDRYGNRTFNTASGNTTTLNLSTPTKVTNPIINTSDNRLKKDQDNDTLTDYDYDQNGNLILDAENKRFVYDAENHQTKFFLQTNSTNTPDATYEYDGQGKRVRKISGQTETIFVYNGGGQLVAEYSNQISSTPQVSYLTADHLGSPRTITDGGGMVISRHDYMAFGNDVTETIGTIGGRSTAQGYNAPDEVRQGYTGYEKDIESKLDYAQARYYNSAHGRFTSVDPLTASATIRDPQTFNRYSYVLNSPYKFTDPLGLIAENSDKWDKIINKKDCTKGCIIGGEMYFGSQFAEQHRLREVTEPDQGVAGNTATPMNSNENVNTAQRKSFVTTKAVLRFGSSVVIGELTGYSVEFNVGSNSADETGLDNLFTGKENFSVELQLNSNDAVEVIPTDIKTITPDPNRPRDKDDTYNVNSSRVEAVGQYDNALDDKNNIYTGKGMVSFRDTKNSLNKGLVTTASFSATFRPGSTESGSNAMVVKIIGRDKNNSYIRTNITVKINYVPDKK